MNRTAAEQFRLYQAPGEADSGGQSHFLWLHQRADGLLRRLCQAGAGAGRAVVYVLPERSPVRTLLKNST